MMYKTFSLSLLAVMLCSVAFAQNPTTKSKLFDKLTPEQRARDSMAYLKRKIDYPAGFLDKRLPQRLLDGNYYVKGYAAFGIKITDNHIVDSVYHNFQQGMGSGVPPYSSIQVTDGKISIDILNPMFLGGLMSDSASIISIDNSKMKDGIIDNKPFSEKTLMGIMGKKNDYFLDTIGLRNFQGDSIELRISINGKLLFDWTKLDHFAKNIFKSSAKWPKPPAGNYALWGLQYFYGYHICEQNIKINDQLLIEIKDDKTGWMLDRFNFIRVAATPTVASISATDDNNKPLPTSKLTGASIEKKTLR